MMAIFQANAGHYIGLAVSTVGGAGSLSIEATQLATAGPPPPPELRVSDRVT